MLGAWIDPGHPLSRWAYIDSTRYVKWAFSPDVKTLGRLGPVDSRRVKGKGRLNVFKFACFYLLSVLPEDFDRLQKVSNGVTARLCFPIHTGWRQCHDPYREPLGRTGTHRL